MGAEDDDADNETVSLTHTFNGGGPAYVGVTIEPVAVTVDDDETASVMVSATTLDVMEGSTGTYTLVLEAPPTVAYDDFGDE